MIGQAAHIMDAIHWFMNSTYPSACVALGTKPELEPAEVPETTTMALEYPENYLAVFTLSYQGMRYALTNDQMKQFHGAKARFDVGREGYSLYPEDTRAIDMKPSQEVKRPGTFVPATRVHIRNFLECVKSRKDPNATVEMGQSTNVALCMAVEALKTGRRVRFDAARRKMV
jgi:predicted dehydrogenase